MTLYPNCPRICNFLHALMIFDFFAGGIWGVIICQRMDIMGACLVKNLPSDGAYLSLLQLTVQGTLWALSLAQIDTNQARKILREGSYVFAATFFILIAYLANIHLAKKFNAIVFFQCTFPLASALVAAINCYLIKNTISESPATEDRSDSVVELATFFQTGVPDIEQD